MPRVPPGGTLDYTLILTGMTEWLPLNPVVGGRLQAIAGIATHREEALSKSMAAPAISALLTSSVVGAAFRSLIPEGNPVVGGSACAALSAMAWMAALMMRFNLLAAEEERNPGVSDGFVAGFIQGMSVLGFGGSGVALAALAGSGVKIREATAVASWAAVPVVLLSPLNPQSLIPLIVSICLLWAARAYRIEDKIRPSHLGLLLGSVGLINARFIPDIYGLASSYQPVVETVLDWVHSYGGPGLVLAMVAQAVISPIPADALLIAAGALGMSPLEVGIYGGIGGTLGALANFYIARVAGRPFVTRLFKEQVISAVDEWFRRWGALAVFVARLLPFSPVDLVSYAAGLSNMGVLPFLAANALALIPRSALFGFLGVRIVEGDWVPLVAVLAILVVGGVTYGLLRKKKLKSADD